MSLSSAILLLTHAKSQLKNHPEYLDRLELLIKDLHDSAAIKLEPINLVSEEYMTLNHVIELAGDFKMVKNSKGLHDAIIRKFHRGKMKLYCRKKSGGYIFLLTDILSSLKLAVLDDPSIGYIKIRIIAHTDQHSIEETKNRG